MGQEIRRGQVWDARLDPVEGSEQAGTRPVLVVSRDAINRSSTVVVVVPITERENKRRLYPSHVVVSPPEGGLDVESVILCEQIRAISIKRLLRLRGEVQPGVMVDVCRAIAITLDCRLK